jgi:ABC-type multidrug transport system permease subunit
MPSSLGTIEAVVLVGAGTAAVGFLAYSLINGESAHAIVGLVAYLGVWVYGLLRASYVEAPPGSPH